MMGWGWNGVSGYGTTWLWMGGMIIFWFAVIGVGIWMIVRLTDRDGSQTQSSESPRAELDRRFANGEVNVVEYAEGRRLLEMKSSSRQ
jgi:uncharacterized membrane protein